MHCLDVSKDASVCGWMTAVPSNYCFPAPDINIVITYYFASQSVVSTYAFLYSRE